MGRAGAGGIRVRAEAPRPPPRVLDTFDAGARALGDRLGPVRVSLKSARDEGALELLLGSLARASASRSISSIPRGTGSSLGSPTPARCA